MFELTQIQKTPLAIAASAMDVINTLNDGTFDVPKVAPILFLQQRVLGSPTAELVCDIFDRLFEVLRQDVESTGKQLEEVFVILLALKWFIHCGLQGNAQLLWPVVTNVIEGPPQGNTRRLVADGVAKDALLPFTRMFI